MANGQTIDYDALAGQHGGTVVVDYDALAKEHGGAAKMAAAPAAEKPGAVERFTKSFAAGMGAPEKLSDIVTGPAFAVTHPIESAKLLGSAIAESHRGAAQAGLERMKQPGIIPKIVGGVEYAESGIPLVGPALVGAGRQAEAGDIAGAAGSTAALGTQVAMASPELQAKAINAPGAAARALKSAVEVPRDSVGRFVRKQGVVGISPKGKLKPGTSAAARLVGGAAGGGAGSIGGPVTAAAGALVGEHAGYGLAESFLPAHPDPRLPTVNEAIKAQLAERYPQIGAYRNAVAARAKAAAQQPAAVAPAATLYPEPRVAGPTERPGAMYSVPREQLPGLAASGTPGAADVLRATGNPVLFEPSSGVGYPGPRAAVEVPAEAAVQPSNAIVARGTIQPRIYTDSMGVKWAEDPNGIRVSIPKRIPEAEVAQYAKTKLAEQAGAQEKVKTSAAITEETPGVETVAQFLKKKREMAAKTRVDVAGEEASRLDLGRLSDLEKRYVADVMETAEYAKLNDAAKKQLLKRRALGGK